MCVLVLVCAPRRPQDGSSVSQISRSVHSPAYLPLPVLAARVRGVHAQTARREGRGRSLPVRGGPCSSRHVAAVRRALPPQHKHRGPVDGRASRLSPWHVAVATQLKLPPSGRVRVVTVSVQAATAVACGATLLLPPALGGWLRLRRPGEGLHAAARQGGRRRAGVLHPLDQAAGGRGGVEARGGSEASSGRGARRGIAALASVRESEDIITTTFR